MKQLFEGVFREGNRIYTVNAVPGRSVYGERLKGSYREWDPYRSKLAAALLNGLSHFPLRANQKVLYLGAASGTTVSHIADIVAEGHVYAVELPVKPAHKLLELAKERANIIPILIDAHETEKISFFLSRCDLIYQDITQRDQSQILLKNAEAFLKPKGHALMCIKARSISSAKPAEEIFKEESKKLEKKFEIIASVRLEPYTKEHIFLVLKKKIFA